MRTRFERRNPFDGEVTRMPAFFFLLSLHHRKLVDVISTVHPLQGPLPFRYVIAIVSGIADALEAAAEQGVVHLDMKEDNVMVDDPEAMDFEAEQRAAARGGPETADSMVVDYSKLIRRFERPPVAVVIDWGIAKAFGMDGWVWRVPARTVDSMWTLALPDKAQPWGNHLHASPELHMEWTRAREQLEICTLTVRRAKSLTLRCASTLSHACEVRWDGSHWHDPCCSLLRPLLCR